MSTTQKVKIIIRNGTTNYTGTLGAGELFYNSSSKKLYIGDGSTVIASLPYFVHFSQTDKNKLDGIATGATKVTESTVSNWGFTKNAGTVTSVKLGSQSYTPSSGVISLPAYPNIVNASNSGTVPSIGTTSTWSTSGNYRFLVSTYSSNTWNEPTWITIGDATSSQRGLMTAAQAEKLNGIAAGANKYSLPIASASTLGGIYWKLDSNGVLTLSDSPIS